MLIDKLHDYTLLEKSWKKVRNRKKKNLQSKTKGYDGQTITDFALKDKELLSDLLKQLKDGSYKPTPFQGFLVKKNDSKYPNKRRLIQSPSIRDRIVQTALLTLITPVLTPKLKSTVNYCLSLSKGLPKAQRAPNTLRAISTLSKSVVKESFGWVYKGDISKFFDTINKATLIESMGNQLGEDKTLISYIEDVVNCPIGNIDEINRRIKKGSLDVFISSKGLGSPQGSSLSPLFANIYLSSLDEKMERKYGSRFFRYVDDFAFIGKTKEEVTMVQSEIREEINNLELKLSAEKDLVASLKSNGIKFLGLNIGRHGILPLDSKLKIIGKTKDYSDRLMRYNVSSAKGISFRDRVKAFAHGVSAYYGYYHVDEIFAKANLVISSTDISGTASIRFQSKQNPYFPIPSQDKWFDALKNT